jgi:hypothetical protein
MTSVYRWSAALAVCDDPVLLKSVLQSRRAP